MARKTYHCIKDSENIFNLIKPIRLIYNIILFFSAKPKKWLYVFVVLVKVIIQLFLLKGAITDIVNENLNYQTSISITLHIVMVAANSLGFIIIIVQIFYHYPLIQKIFSKLDEFDKCLWKYYQVKYTSDGKIRKTRNRLIVLVFLIFAYYIIKAGILTVQYSSFRCSIWIEIIYKMNLTIIVIQNGCILNFIRWKLHYLNNFIKHSDCSITSETKIVNNTNLHNWNSKEYCISIDVKKHKINDLKKKLTFSRLIYAHISDIICLCNSSFGKYYPYLLILTYGELIENSFFIFIIFTYLYENPTFWPLLTTMMMNILFGYSFLVTIILYFSYSIRKESDGIGNSIHELYLLSSFKDYIKNEIKLFALQIKQKNIMFTAHDIIALEWSYLVQVR